MQDGLRPLGRERGWLAVLLVPTMIGLVFGTVGSIFATILISLTKWDLISAPQFVGLQNFVGLLSDKLFLKSITVTISFALLYVPGTMIVSLLIALLLNRKLRGTGIFRTVYFLPAVSSAVAVGLVWSWIYAKDTGLLNYLLAGAGAEPVAWLAARNALYSVVIVNIWGAVGEGAIIFLAGLQAVPNDYHEAAQVDGANSWQRFFKITLPLLTPSIFFQTIIATINAFQAFEYVYVLTRGANGASQIPTMVYSIWQNGFRWFNMGSASAQALVLAAILIVLTLIYNQLQKRWVVYD
jgi:multiple sugar transport system permease protein